MLKLVTTLIFLSLSAHAGDKVGNGGGLWVCGTFTNFSKGHLVDLYEAQEEFKLEILRSYESDPMKIVQERSDFVRGSLPVYSQKWNAYLASSFSKLRMVNAELIVVDDHLTRLKPSPYTCNSTWTYVQFANFTAQDQILIQNDLWNSPHISSVDKAALIWHETVYYWLRTDYGDTDSVRAREITGILFSTLPPAEMNQRIAVVLGRNSAPPPPPTPPVQPLPPTPAPVQPLWSCLIKNPHTSHYYFSYGINFLEAKSNTTQECKNSDDGFFCSESSLQCEEITNTQETFVCENKNRLTSKVFSARGRSRLEAESKARQKCQKSGDAFHCENNVQCM